MKHLKWVEIDGSAPDWNLSQLRSCSDKGGILFCAVVKSNAYGHGVEQMVTLLPSADWFAVNCLDEGLELRALGVRKPVLLLGHVLLDRLREAVDADLRLTVYNRETIEELGRVLRPGETCRIHVKVETGTGRQGIFPSEVPGFVDLARGTPGILVEGLSTHFANIEDTLNHNYAEGQLSEFRRALDQLRVTGSFPEVVHTACTAATILFPETHFNMLRTGIGLYGLWPSRETFLSARSVGRMVPDLRPVLSWKTRLVQIKELPQGSYIGYGCTYRTSRWTRLGVLPVGYADGYDRKCGNSAHVLVRGKRAPVLGRVCMNLIMIDLTDIPDARLEDEVVLLGRDGEECISAETMAEWVGTINYEVVTRISPFLPRVIAGRG
ncbi:MAG: alanine racemase [Candidatus Fermentibacteraceae bacterium]|nr:alanine racemase [Candidatus Fermentibacteraceae bacterium]MBN2608778.1 alanine racemase [Candidatus Fermentibacteraceae bacterium]